MCAAKKAMDHDLRISMYVGGSSDGRAQSKHARRGCRVRVEGTWSTGAEELRRRAQVALVRVVHAVSRMGDGGSVFGTRFSACVAAHHSQRGWRE